MHPSTLCIGADVHLDEIVLHAVDKADGHEVVQRFRVTNNLPGAQSAAATIAQTATQGGYTRVEIGWEATGLDTIEVGNSPGSNDTTVSHLPMTGQWGR